MNQIQQNLIKQLVTHTRELSQQYRNQNYKSLSEVLLKEQEFKNLPQFQQLSQFLENPEFDKQIFNVIPQNSQKQFLKNVVSYAQVQENQQQGFSIGIFFIPKDFYMPFHDHPGMYVFQKILCGKAVRTSIDLQSRMNIAKQFTYPLGLVKDDQIKKCRYQSDMIEENQIEIITPNQKNIHGYRAVEDIAFIDILVPTYDFRQRFCNYYDIMDLNENTQECDIKIKLEDPNFYTERVQLGVEEYSSQA